MPLRLVHVSRSAVTLVLQRGDGSDLPAGRTAGREHGDSSAGATLVVVMRPAVGEARGVVVHAIDGATCPVLIIAPAPG